MRSPRNRSRRRAAARTLGVIAAAGALVISSAASVHAAPTPDRTARSLPSSLSGLKLDAPATATVQKGEIQRPATGVPEGQVIVRLSSEAGAQAFVKGRSETAARNAARAQQDAFVQRLKALDPQVKIIARTQMALNAVFVEVKPEALARIAADQAVVSVNPVGRYTMDLSETVPYIGATAVQQGRETGKGVRVAVLDSGIDYTHKALGGSGSVAEYQANDPAVIERGTFPTAKVKGGYDFVGSTWPDTAEAPDPDPLDDGPESGHGTHVAHIIGGTGGVAPGVDLYGVKVCSSISTACSGIAMIQGLEWSLDPNGDGRINDRMHVINMSLGSDYGQPFDDDASAAVDNLSKVGVLTVASAGNGGDKPYITGTPAAADSALSVAQTAVPSGTLPMMEILAPPSIAGTVPAVWQPWSKPLTQAVQGPVVFGDGAGGNLLGCEPFAPGSLAGKVVLVNRGTCNFSLKISNIAEGGGIMGLIGMVDGADPFTGAEGDGDSRRLIPGFMISKVNADRLRAGLPQTVVRIDPASGIPLKGSIVGSSSRGPQHEDTTRIKPEIGAPGASVSAIAGSGTGEGPFGGTSGAAPMVSGAAALVLGANGGGSNSNAINVSGKAVGHGLSPLEIKALLMNNAETNIVSNPVTGALAEITRIGAGEVRVDRAVDAPMAAWVDGTQSSALGFGFVDVTDTWTGELTVRIRNYKAGPQRTYSVTPSYRFADDQANGAVTISAPTSVAVRPGKGRETTFTVKLTIDGSKLRGNHMNSGSQGADPSALTLNEYDGYITLKHGDHVVNLPWHVLPRKAAEAKPSTSTLVAGGNPQVIGVTNAGVGTAQLDAYALIATSPKLTPGGRGQQSPTPDINAVGVNTYPVPAGYCSASPSFVWAFAVNTHVRQQHLVPVAHQFWLDTNRDGVDDYVVLNSDASGLSTVSDGRQLAWTVNLATGEADAWFYAEHSMNTGNTVLTFCAEQVGLGGADMLTRQVGMDVLATDFYNGGPGDAVSGLVVTPLGERWVAEATDVPGRSTVGDALRVTDYGASPGNTPDLGLMVFANGDRGAGNRGGATQATEVLLLKG